MNLHNIASGCIGAINPNTAGTLQPSEGYVTNDDGSRSPSYEGSVPVQVQVQALTTAKLVQLEQLNIAGSTHVLFISGEIDGVLRADRKGGDLITLSDGRRYLVTAVLEQWSNWAQASVTMQVP